MVSTLKSTRFISLLYPVNEVVETYVDVNGLYPYRYRSRQQEGSYTSDKEILFDRENNTATYINHKAGGKKYISGITAGTQDPLSVIYFLRTLPLKIGESVNIDVHDGRKNWTLVIEILKRERIWTPAGTFNTVKIKALIKYEGLFVNKGDMFVWFTDDDARIPVRIESKIKIGYITAMLIEKR
jgi:hypothetical protein